MIVMILILMITILIQQQYSNTMTAKKTLIMLTFN